MKQKQKQKQKLRNLLLIAVCALGSAVAPAEGATTAELTISGTIIPGACTPTLDNGGEVNYGQMYDSSFTAASNSIGTKTLNLNITCDDYAKVAITATDNRADTIATGISVANAHGTAAADSTAADLFGLGTTGGANPVAIGAFTLWIDSAQMTVDFATGTDKYVLSKADINSTVAWSHNTVSSVPNGSMIKYPFAITLSTSASAAVAFKTATLPITVSAAVVEYSTLGTTEKVTLDGNVTIGLVYL